MDMKKPAPTIYIADDNPILLEGLQRALSVNGYVVETACTGAVLLERLEAAPAPPDLLLLDVMMPEMGGLDVLSRLRTEPRWADVPVILITAATDEELAVSALQSGATDFLTKPFRLGELIARVGSHLNRFRELRRAQAESELRLQVIDVVRELNSIVTADEMFRLVTTRVAEILKTSHCGVLIEEGSGVCRVAASAGAEYEAASLLSVSAYPELGSALESDAPVLVEDIATSPLFVEARADAEGNGGPFAAESALAVPFRISELARGVLLLRASAGERQLDEEALTVARQLVDGMVRTLGRTEVFETVVEQRRQLQDLANMDDLTGCASRRAVMRYLTEEFELARRLNRPLAVAVLDLDHFKKINDSHGHLAGDAVLRTFGEWLRSEGAHRVKDYAGRYGGDEFVIVLPETGTEGAICFAERARAYLASMTFVFGDTPTHTSLSAGIAGWPVAEVMNAEQLLECADAALYLAKQAGRDCVRLARLNGHFAVEAP
jgi:two-component system, cell cycle response regulator